MSAYKKLNKQDVFVSTYNAQKLWEVSGSRSELSDSYGIKVLRGFKDETPGYPYLTDFREGQYQALTWQSIYQNYYSIVDKEGNFSGSFDSIIETSFISESRQIQEEIAVFSISQNVTGTHLEPNSIIISPFEYTASVLDGYYLDDYARDRYVVLPYNVFGSVREVICSEYIENEGDYVLETLEAGGEYLVVGNEQHRIEIIDDGEGKLIYSGSRLGSCTDNSVVGDVIYSHGQIIITNPDVARYYSTYLKPRVKWKSNLPIYTYNVHCKVKDTEMNFTYNPSAVNGASGDLASNVSGPDFQPYITTIGLYNDANELLAVAKYSKPIPKPNNTDMTLIVQIDI